MPFSNPQDGAALASSGDRLVGIYEPLYLPGQRLNEPDFLPLHLEDNAHAEWREFRFLVDTHRRGLHRRHRFTGLFSPKFRLKSKLTGRQFIDFVTASADADVCFVNPFPQHPQMAFNGWVGGEVCHSGLMARTQALLDAASIGWRVGDQPHHGPDVSCFCNFWVASERFWDDYVGGVLVPLADFIEHNPKAPQVTAILETTRHTSVAAFLPFAVERMFTTYLVLQPGFKVAALQLDPKEYCFNPFERDLLAFVQPLVERARLGFSPELRSLLDFIQLVRENYFAEYYKTHVHPHVGRTVDFGNLPPPRWQRPAQARGLAEWNLKELRRLTAPAVSPSASG